MSLRGALVPFALVLVLGGCNQLGIAGGSGTGGPNTTIDPPENTAPPVDALDDPAHPGIEACSQGLTSAEIDAELQVARDFRESCHEMVVCGGLMFSASTSVISILINAAQGDDTHPPGLYYVGDGLWRAGSQMELKVHLGFDTSFGAKGDVVTFDVFDVASYFQNATISATASIDSSGNSSTSFGVTFDGVGPGIELLGLGPNPKSPLAIDLEAFAEAFGKLELSSHVTVDNAQGDSHVTYDLSGDPLPIGAFLDGNGTGMDLTSVSVSNATTGQAIGVSDWGMIYQPGSSGTLDGSIAFHVTGGKMPYDAKFTYPHRKAPDVALACPTGG